MKSYIRKISCILLLSICLSFFLPYTIDSYKPKKNLVDAQFKTFSTIVANLFQPMWENFSKRMWDGLDALAKKVAVMLILQLTQDIVAWIDNGFQGNPAFLQDPGGFLETVGDKAIGDFIFNEPGLKFLCDPFRVQIQLALGLQYQPFKNTVECTFTDVLKNTENAYDAFVGGDFINGGGWESWFNITTNPANNAQGAFLIAKSELDARIKTSQENTNREVGWGNGSFSLQKCVETEYTYTPDPNGGATTKQPTGKAPREFVGNPFYDEKKYQEEADAKNIGGNEDTQQSGGGFNATEIKCNVTTPGTIITEKLAFTTNSAGRMTEIWAATAKSFDAIFTALANQVLKTALNGIKDGILGSSKSGTDYEQEYRQALAQLQDQQRTYDDQVKKIAGGTGNNNTGLTDQQNSAISKINTALQTENDFLSVRRQAKESLNATKEAFASTSLCLTTSSDPNKDMRKSLIRDINSTIQGTNVIPPPDLLTIGGKIININTLNIEIEQARANIATLEAKKETVSSATTATAINSAISDLTSTTYHQTADIKETTYSTRVNSWLTQLISTYASPSAPCSININSLNL